MLKHLLVLLVSVLISVSAEAQYSYWKSTEKKISTGAVVLGYQYRDLSYFYFGYNHAFDILDTYWDYRPEVTFGISGDNKVINATNAVYIPWDDRNKLFLLNFGLTGNFNFPQDVNGMSVGLEAFGGVDFMYLASLRVGYNYFLTNDSALLKSSIMASVQVNVPLGLIIPPYK